MAGSHLETPFLDELGLKFDRDGNCRTQYGLRRTYICLRLMEEADIYPIAMKLPHQRRDDREILRTHIKNTLAAAAINSRRT